MHPEPIQPSTPRPIVPETVQLVVLHGVHWDTYERLLAEHEESLGTRFTYDQGTLEIMVLSAKHEALKDALTLLVNILAEEMAIDVRSFGSTTFQRADLSRGFEPDACFYIQHEAQVSGKDELDLSHDPAPDLVLEIDLSSSSLNKFPIFAVLGVLEVWRWDGAQIIISVLQDGRYVEVAESLALPKVSATALRQFVDTSRQLKRTAWLRRIREWVRQESAKAG
jgi:Uma2 family endonuclease